MDGTIKTANNLNRLELLSFFFTVKNENNSNLNEKKADKK